MSWLSITRLPRPHDSERQSVAWTRWKERTAPPDNAAGVALLDALFGNSPYLTETALQNPDFMTDIWRHGPDAAFADQMSQLAAAHADALAGAKPEAIGATLRRLKRRVALTVAVADIADVWSLDRVTGALSDFASGCLGALMDSILLQLSRDGQLGIGNDPEAAAFTVLGMGKLGAGELNYSSDIDLILLYDRDAPALAGNEQLSRHFVRGARLLVQLMSEASAEGYIFRTDLRLRPDPGSTPLAMSVQAAELYYESVGQNWERAAMIKAHPVAGNRAVGAAFLKDMTPYIWRKHLDFAAIHDIHSIKRQIDAHRGGGTVKVLGHNVKLGRGGIREIEFFAQTQQLIFGGRNPSLRLRGTCETLRALAAAGHVTSRAAEELIEAYGYLRRVEHRLQMIDDRQTHSLPADEAGVAAVATFLGYDDPMKFQADLLDTLRCVESHYARLFEEAPSLAGPGGNLVFTGTDDDPGTLETLKALGFRDTSAAAAIVRRWHHGRYRSTATARARELLTELMPGLLKSLGETASPDQALLNFDLFLGNLPAGVQLFSLFKANPALLELLATIMGSAPGLAAHLSRRALLLDSVLSPDFYRPLPPAAEMTAELAAILARVDHEQDILDLARRWTNDRRFQVGVQQLKHIVKPAQAGHAYSDIAAASISALCDRVEQRFADTHGGFQGQRLAVLGLGKLGSREMSATSDLDLIFVYDIPDGMEVSDGAQPLSPIQYYTRLSQKIVTALTAHTNEGALYEVDMRLRPSGRAGPLANSLEGFETYHAQSAWTWEHMALTRMRVIHGPSALVGRLTEIVKATLCRTRDPATLVRDVADMRDRIAQHAPPKSAWDFKHLRGGLFDIDFVAQYLALHHAAKHPDILDPHPAEMLQRMATAGLIATEDADRLCATRTLLSDVQSLLRLTLNGDEAAFDETKAPEGQRRLIAATEGASDLGDLQMRIGREADTVRAIYERIVEAPARAAGWVPRKEGKGSER
ncbi:bifunctional [glutamine synthetase] adenylyltransferase/[glutamine synthetase]-adenylyl-L-tyrosine phosphorylase [Reyranella sp.]|uniref:bifunctional [glutamine synthetase] adenylyltransferase/[glutamine synthetase]-adenylyl-L-tyrosine phosphorylase n=1 Tax=Reyranella sp. TaxID=1929291 RepID=UPI00121600A0|nr:bifunctional [glutamine synthetase] adenylyltransferase/[glutamine synthetase]-adenylyl-L-tyrosine phosphorylase [Reyranella sp.]TAJ90064.1 MAG: bifunctional [glutamine synthetase] adenylyltransferase/[glutamine synthetase]-adenylyl-L-tyrosine phosphorylase [Reyranella sp.]